MGGENQRNQILFQYLSQYLRDKKKKKKEGGSKKGGENSPISPPLDPRLSPCFDPVDLSLIKRSMRLCHQNSLRLLIRNHREASVLSPLAHTPQHELFLSS